MTVDPHRGEPSDFIHAGHKVQVFDPKGIPSPLIIDDSDDFQVAMKFEVFSPYVTAILCVLCCEIRYCAESMCPGEDCELGTVKIDLAPGQTVYDATSKPVSTALTVKAGTLKPGVYRLSAMAMFCVKCCCSKCPPRRYPLHAFSEGPAIHVFQ